MPITIAISLIIISIIIPIIFKTNESANESNDRVIFGFNKAFKNVMLACVVIFIIVTFVFLILKLINVKDSSFVPVIFFAIFALISSFLYLLAKNKKIIYENKHFDVYNVFGKKEVLNIGDLKEAIEVPMDGMKLLFNNNKKIKIDVQMNNYAKIKGILENNNIICKSKNGTNAPKGW